MRLDFVRSKVLFVGSFQGFWIVVLLDDFITTRLMFLCGDIIGFKIMMISGFAIKFGGYGRTMMFAWDERKKYRMCRFGRHTCY